MYSPGLQQQNHEITGGRRQGIPGGLRGAKRACLAGTLRSGKGGQAQGNLPWAHGAALKQTKVLVWRVYVKTWTKAYGHMSKDDRKAEGCGPRHVGLTVFKQLWQRHFLGLKLAGETSDVCKFCRGCTLAEVKSSVSGMEFKYGPNSRVDIARA